MRATFRLRLAYGFFISIVGSGFSACHKAPPPPPQSDPAPVRKSPEEIQKLADSANRSLAELEPRLASLNAKFDSLHKLFDPLPPDLPEYGETRSKFYAADEGLGRMNAKLPWLASQIESAIKASDGAQMEELSKSVTRTFDDVQQVDRLALELLHEVMPFTRMAENYAANTKGMCDPGGVSATPGVSRAAAAQKLAEH